MSEPAVINVSEKNPGKIEGRRVVLSVFGGAFFSLCLLLGGMLEEKGYLFAPTLFSCVQILVCWIMFSVLFYAAFTLLQERRTAKERKCRIEGGWLGRRAAAWDALPEKKKNLLIFLFFMVIDLISLLAVYPGFFVYDAAEELSMVQTRTFTTHHPLLHVLLLGGVILLVHKISGSYNLGIFLYLLLQMSVILLAFTYLLSDLRRRKTARGVRLFGLLWLVLCPTVTMFVLCSCKDGLFAAFLLVMTIELRRMLLEEESFFGQRKIHRILFVFCAALMMLFRNNGVYAYVVFLLLYLAAGILFRLKKSPNFLRSILLVFLPLLLYAGISKGLETALQADTSESQEILTVPLMQLARTWAADPSSFTGEEQQLMESLMEEGGWEMYNPVLSDQMKARFKSDVYRENRSAFWRMWLHQFLEHPMTYLNAWLMTSYGFWYPNAVIDCYEGNIVYTFTYAESSYFGYETEEPGVRRSLIPVLDSFYRYLSLDVRSQKIPVLHLILSPGALYWCFAFMLLVLLEQRRKKALLCYLPILLVYMTVLLGPCTLPRYVVYLWFGLPLFMAEVFSGREYLQVL